MTEETTTAPLARHTHAGGLFSLPLPTMWLIRENVLGAALICAEIAEPGQPAPNVVVTVESMSGMPLEQWTAQARDSVVAELERARVIDEEAARLGDLPGRRTLIHHLDHEVGGVVLEQWVAAHRDWGLVLSCTCGALEYDDLADVFATIAAGFATHEGRP